MNEKERIKYPRTFHLPWSPGRSNDDKVLQNTKDFEDRDVVATLKMDGECTSMYSDGYIHARSIDSIDHPSRHWVKGYLYAISHRIPEGWRVCGENLYARHSIPYDSLPSYFMVFSVWSGSGCLPWAETVQFCRETGFVTVPVIYEGLWTADMQSFLSAVFKPYERHHEGYVIRTTDGFELGDFQSNVAKFVRSDHVQTDEHWLNKRLIKNCLTHK